MKEWIKWLLLGVVSMAFGVFVLGNAMLASIAITTLTGVLFLLSGGFQVFGGVTADDGLVSKSFNVLLGVLMLFLGGSFLFNPLEGTISLALLVLILFVASGVVRIILSWRMRETRFFWPMLISVALTLLLAGYIWANFAVAGPQLLGVLMGVELLFNGAGLVVLAFFIRTVGQALQ